MVHPLVRVIPGTRCLQRETRHFHHGLLFGLYPERPFLPFEVIRHVSFQAHFSLDDIPVMNDLAVHIGVIPVIDLDTALQRLVPPFLQERIVRVGESTNTVINVLDITGQVIKTIYVGEVNGDKNLTISLDEMSTGIYFIELVNADGRQVKKFVKR